MEKYFLSESKNVEGKYLLAALNEEEELRKLETRQLLATLNEIIKILRKFDRNYMVITDLIYHKGWKDYKLDGAEVTIHVLLDCYKGIIECFERNHHLKKSKLEAKQDATLETILRRIVVLLNRLSDVNCKECTTQRRHHRIIGEAISKQQFSYDGEWIFRFVHKDLAEALETARAEIFHEYVDWEGVYTALSAQ